MGLSIGRFKRITLVLLAIGVWLAWCLPSLLANRPDAFQASGSVIVVLAVLLYARERSQRENEVTQAQRRQIVAMLEEHESWGSYHESRVSRSALETELQNLETRACIQNSDENSSPFESRIVELQQTLNETHSRHEQLYQNMQHSHAHWAEVHKEAEDIVQSQAPAAKILERLEIALVVLGTLQWGYGDQWVEYVHNLF